MLIISFHKLKIIEIWFVGRQKSLFSDQKIAGENQTDFSLFCLSLKTFVFYFLLGEVQSTL